MILWTRLGPGLFLSRATPSVIGNKLKNANKWEFETFLKYSLYETGL